MARFLAILLASVMFAACDETSDNQATPPSAEELFAQGKDEQSRNRNLNASQTFETLQQLHPHDPLAVQAQFEEAMSLYNAQKYADAVVAFDEFLAFNPGHELQLEAIYFRIRSFYDEIPDVFRDQAVTRNAETALLDLIEQYPETERAQDAQAKLVLIYDQLAGHEMVIGRSYQIQNQHLAAQNRFKRVIEDYPTTSQIPEAFYRLVETSLALGLAGEARRYGATLGYNYPSSPWYHRTYALLVGP